MSVFIKNTIRSFSRYHKYGIGTDLCKIARQIAFLTIRAYQDKAPVLGELVEAYEPLGEIFSDDFLDRIVHHLVVQGREQLLGAKIHP